MKNSDRYQPMEADLYENAEPLSEDYSEPLLPFTDCLLRVNGENVMLVELVQN
jgi:hypothetical protein